MLVESASLDSHIRHVLLFRLWMFFVGVLLFWRLPASLSAVEQGYYFTFASILAAQVFFEMGLNYVIIQLVGREMVQLVCQENGQLNGSPEALYRLQQLIALIKRVYVIVAIAFFVLIGLGGSIFLARYGSEQALSVWLPAWLAMIFFNAINLWLSPFLSLLEGTGQVGQVAKVRLIQSILGYSVLLLLWQAQWGLWAVPSVGAFAACISAFWLKHKFRKLLPKPVSCGDHRLSTLSWRRDIFPFQWKIAISWISNYFIFQWMTPMVFMHRGAIEAGRFGLTLMIFNTILSFSISWLVAKSPIMAKRAAAQQRDLLDRLFWDTTLKSGLLNAFLCLTAWLSLLGMQIAGWAWGRLVSDWPIYSLLVLVSLANHLVYAFAAYIRAHAEEPLLLNSVVTSCLVAMGVYIGSQYSLLWAIGSYTLVIMVISLPWTYKWFRYYQQRFNVAEEAC